MIDAWDNLTFNDWASDGTSHGYIRDKDGAFYRACYRHWWLGESTLREGGRLQTHIPELPLCPQCAELAGLSLIGANRETTI